MRLQKRRVCYFVKTENCLQMHFGSYLLMMPLRFDGWTRYAACAGSGMGCTCLSFASACSVMNLARATHCTCILTAGFIAWQHNPYQCLSLARSKTREQPMVHRCFTVGLRGFLQARLPQSDCPAESRLPLQVHRTHRLIYFICQCLSIFHAFMRTCLRACLVCHGCSDLYVTEKWVNLPSWAKHATHRIQLQLQGTGALVSDPDVLLSIGSATLSCLGEFVVYSALALLGTAMAALRRMVFQSRYVCFFLCVDDLQ